MDSKITIRGSVGQQQVFLNGMQVFPTRVEIIVTPKLSTAKLIYENAEIERAVHVSEVEEVREPEAPEPEQE